MEKFSTCELREKEVINVCDGTRLGCPADFEFNVYQGVITALIIKPCLSSTALSCSSKAKIDASSTAPTEYWPKIGLRVETVDSGDYANNAFVYFFD